MEENFTNVFVTMELLTTTDERINYLNRGFLGDKRTGIFVIAGIHPTTGAVVIFKPVGEPEKYTGIAMPMIAYEQHCEVLARFVLCNN